MTITSIILLILLGLFLLIVEILFVPGMVLGFISVILMITGIILSYSGYGNTVGTIVLASTAIISLGTVYWAFKTNVWKRFSVLSSMDGKANVIEAGLINEGDFGTTNSRLNPIGKAFINGKLLEVQSLDGFIDEKKDIIVSKVQSSKIYVKLKA